MKTSLPPLVSTVALVLLLGGCDATGPSDTVILNANSPESPTVEYDFAYETNGNNAIGVQSDGTDNLSSILTQNGFSREDVVSARVDSVRLERISSKEKSPPRKVFDYLAGTTVYLGSDTGGKRIAEASLNTTQKSISLPVAGSDVTSIVKGGSTPAFLQLDTTNDVPDRQDRVTVTVYFRIEVQGV